MKKYLVEFIGTFFLVFTIGMAVNFAGNMAPVAIGCGLIVMVYAGGHVSGAHYNPAVTTAMLIRRAIKLNDALMYWIAQLLGAVCAAFIIWKFNGKPLIVAPGPGYGTLKILAAEIIGTFALVYVVLNVATQPKTHGNSFYGLAIGFTITAMAYAVGGISGGAFNPAVGVGPNLVAAIQGSATLGNIWIYIVGPITGGALAALVYVYINGYAQPEPA